MKYDVDKAVIKWIKIVLDKNMPISRPLIQEKAAEYARLLDMKHFKPFIVG